MCIKKGFFMIQRRERSGNFHVCYIIHNTINFCCDYWICTIRMSIIIRFRSLFRPLFYLLTNFIERITCLNYLYIVDFLLIFRNIFYYIKRLQCCMGAKQKSCIVIATKNFCYHTSISVNITISEWSFYFYIPGLLINGIPYNVARKTKSTTITRNGRRPFKAMSMIMKVRSKNNHQNNPCLYLIHINNIIIIIIIIDYRSAFNRSGWHMKNSKYSIFYNGSIWLSLSILESPLL
eukprot:284814913_1